MAYVVNVQPTYNNAVKVVSNDAMDGTILSNNLTPEVLLNIWNTYPQMRDYLYLQWVDIVGSYPAGTINASLLHAYDSSEVSHNPTKTDYLVGSTGKHLNETRSIIDTTVAGFTRPANRPSFMLDFSNSKFIDPVFGFTRNSVGTYIDNAGVMRIASANRPRFTQDWVTNESLGLLYEDTSTNLITYSENYLASQPSTTVETVTHNRFAGIAVRKITCTDNNDPKVIIAENVGTLGSRTFTMSVYLWTNESTPSKHYLRIHGNTSIEQLTEKQIEVTNVPTLFTVVKTFVNATSTLINIRFDPFESDASAATGRILYAAAWQLEEKEIATSYIPTSGVRVTRASESFSVTQARFSQYFGDAKKGVMFINVRIQAKTGLSSFFKLNTVDDTKKLFIAYNYVANAVYCSLNNGTTTISSANISTTSPATVDVLIAMNFNRTLITFVVNGVSTTLNSVDIPDFNQAVFASTLGMLIKSMAYYPDEMSLSMLKLLTTKQIAGNASMSMQPANVDLGRNAYLRPESVLRTLGRQEFTVHGTGVSESRNIRRPYDFTFEIVDSSGVTTISAQPAGSCTANTDNTLTLNAPVGKSLVYAITPVYDN